MTDSDIQLDDDIQMTPQSKGGIPTWAVILVILPFLFLATVVAMQIMELLYLKAPGPNGSSLF